MSSLLAPALNYAAALARLPADALPAALAGFWLAQADAGVPMRDRADVLADTLAILVELNADAEVLAAALLDALVDVEALAKQAALELPERLHVLLEGQRAASRVWALHRDHGGGRNPEGMRRLLLALVRDLRVIPIVLARQLSRMRAAWRLPADEQRALARMTRDIHAPLANRLGIWQLKWELEDLAFRVLQAEDYLRIAQSLDDNRAGRERYIEAVRTQLSEAVAAQGIPADVAGRPKHIYSIWKKMQRKALPIEE
ncbi:MAG TPA: HD domain-containing protein, partial [Thermomonas sp.]|nr:HD domain-containing protein [Thermomonas sp.]